MGGVCGDASPSGRAPFRVLAVAAAAAAVSCRPTGEPAGAAHVPEIGRGMRYWRGCEERTPGPFLCVRPAATGVTVACDRWPDCSDLRRFGLDAVRLSGAKTPHEEALAVWQWMRRVKISTNGDAPIDPFNPERADAQVDDAIKVMNVFGAHWCSGLGRVNALIWRAMGREAHALHRFSHGMAALRYRDADGLDRWHLFDCNFGGYTLDRTGKRILGPDEFSTDWYQWMHPWYFGEPWPMPTHRVELALRPGEKLERIWGNWGQPFQDNVSRDCTNPPGSERGPYRPVYGNGRWTYAPDLARPDWIEGLAGPPKGLLEGKLQPAEAGRRAEAVWHFRTPYIAVESEVRLGAFRKTDRDEIRLSLSVDDGSSWKECWRAPAGATGEREFRVRLDGRFDVVPGKWKVPAGFNSPFGRYAYRLKLELLAAGQPADCRVEGISFDTVVQQNILALPQLQPGRNRIGVRGELAAGAALKITYVWDDPVGKDRTNATVIENLPWDYEIVAAGRAWTDCVCQSVTVEALRATGAGNRTVVKEESGEAPEPPPVAPASASRLRWMRPLHQEKPPSIEQVGGWIADPRTVDKGLLWASELGAPQLFDAARKAALSPECGAIKGVKEQALLALYNTDREKARPVLLEIALDEGCRTGWKHDPEDPAVAGGHWMSAVCIVGQIAAESGWKEFVPVLVKAMNSRYCGSERSRMSILRSLSALAEPGDAAVTAAVRKSLAMEFPYMLAEAAELAGRLGDQGSIPRLRALLDHPFLAVRRRAAVALGRLGDLESAPKLRECLVRIPRPEVLDHRKYGTEICFDENLRAAAARALGEMRDAGSLPALRAALEREPVEWVREVMDEALKRIGPVLPAP